MAHRFEREPGGISPIDRSRSVYPSPAEGSHGYGRPRGSRAPLAMPPEEERRCVERAAGGDTDAIGLLYDAYIAPLYRFCLARVGNETDAEDLTEEIFLKVMRSIHTFRWRPPAPAGAAASGATAPVPARPASPAAETEAPPQLRRVPPREAPVSPFRAWLFRIARNHVISHYRREALRSTAGEVPDWLPDASRGPAELAETRLTIEEVFAVVEQLPPAQRDVIRLRFGAGLSVQETAEALSKQQTNIKVLQHKGVKRLKELLLPDPAARTIPEDNA